MRRKRNVVQVLHGPGDAIDPRVDAVELRLDRYPRFDPDTDKPIIVTVRRLRDGGGSPLSDDERVARLFENSRHGEWVDLELDVAERLAEERGGLAGAGFDPARVIVSFHDFDGLPDDLDTVFQRCLLAGGGGARVKIAARPESTVDAFRLLELPMGGLAIGEFGGFTRVLAPLTYCAHEPANAILSHILFHMPTPEDLFDTYRIARLGPAPALFGVAGDPIDHSKSPQIFNEAFERAGIDAAYLRFRVSDLSSFWPEFVAHGGRGLSVTAPLKVQAAKLATDPSEEVVRCGAANTLLADGRAYNTDYKAFLEMIPRAHKDGEDALVLGAGGAARAAIVALEDLGYAVTVRARSTRGLEREFDVEFVEGDWWRSPDAVDTADDQPHPPGGVTPQVGVLIPGFSWAPVVINATPKRFAPEGSGRFVLELAYGPGNDAGLAFLRAQAAHQYDLFASMLDGRSHEP